MLRSWIYAHHLELAAILSALRATIFAPEKFSQLTWPFSNGETTSNKTWGRVGQLDHKAIVSLGSLMVTSYYLDKLLSDRSCC